MKAIYLLLFTGLGLQLTAAPLTVAVFEFQSPEEGQHELGPKLSALMGASLSADERFITVEREELDKALGEQELGLSGSIAADTAAKVGHLTGANLLVTGRVMKSDRETIVVAKLIGTETGRVFAAKATLPPDGSLQGTASELAKELAETAVKNAAALVAPVDQTEAVVSRMKAALKADKRGAVSVLIPEQHFGTPVIDPAAQTELAMLLKECGFTILDEKSAVAPEYAIEGEAFSERGYQKGRLISCKARVEVKVRRRSNGEIVFTDSEVGRAIDLAEHIAAKEALREAARKLAVRLVSAL